MFINNTTATYVVEGEIVLLRSQFNDDTIKIDGVIDEEIWTKTGSVIIDYGTDNNIEIKFTNDLDYLYYAISIPSENAVNTSIGLFFDVDGDGILSTPEDGKVLFYDNSSDFYSDDYYWNGDTWEKDQVKPGTDDFSVSQSVSDGIVNIELRILLISDNIQYSGWQIPTTTNSYIAFTSQFVFPVDNSTMSINYPSNPSNVTGFVDLKLAGPEDKDLPKYIPPTYVDYNDTADTPDLGGINGGQSVNAIGISNSVAILAVFSTALIVRRRYR